MVNILGRSLAVVQSIGVARGHQVRQTCATGQHYHGSARGQSCPHTLRASLQLVACQFAFVINAKLIAMARAARAGVKTEAVVVPSWDGNRSNSDSNSNLASMAILIINNPLGSRAPDAQSPGTRP